MQSLRVVFAGCDGLHQHDSQAFQAAVAALADKAHTVTFRPGVFYARGPAAYLALEPEHLALWEPWFPGLQVRVQARLLHAPLEQGGAMYLPVTFDSWVVVCDGSKSLGAGLEAASLLKGVTTAVCPAYDPVQAAASVRGLCSRYERRHDRVWPADAPA